MQYVVPNVLGVKRRLQSSFCVTISFLKLLPHMDSCVEKKEVYQDISSYYLGVISGITDNFM